MINEGNFRELLRFRIDSGDTDLENHLKTSSSRATYISKTTQNDIINCCGEEILEIITKRIQEAQFYSIIFDETTDIAHVSQLSLNFRYTHVIEGQYVVREDFVKFVDLYGEIYDPEKEIEPKLTGERLGQVVINTIRKLNIDLTNCVGIGTDGCSLMVSEVCGAVSVINKQALNAVYSPCNNHLLNLSISRSSKVQGVRNAVGKMKNIIAFFNFSAKRMVVLRKYLHGGLSGLCETRWVERHESVLEFRSSLAKIAQALLEISLWRDASTSSLASGLLSSIKNSEFLVSLICLSDVLTCTVPLSRFLQRKRIDLKAAQDMLADTLTALKRKREKCEVIFHSLFEEITSIAEIELEMEITVPRKPGRQAYRENYPANEAENYYRQAIYIPIIENVTEDLKRRLSDDAIKLYSFSILFPTSKPDDDDEVTECIQNLARRYFRYFNKSEDSVARNIKLELELWKIKLEREKGIEQLSGVELIQFCDSETYPHLHVLFRIFITLPISNATSERSFSCLRRLKDWLRATMEEDRLVALALLNIHRDIGLDPNKVIDRYAKTRNHRWEFTL